MKHIHTVIKWNCSNEATLEYAPTKCYKIKGRRIELLNKIIYVINIPRRINSMYPEVAEKRNIFFELRTLFYFQAQCKYEGGKRDTFLSLGHDTERLPHSDDVTRINVDPSSYLDTITRITPCIWDWNCCSFTLFSDLLDKRTVMQNHSAKVNEYCKPFLIPSKLMVTLQ